MSSAEQLNEILEAEAPAAGRLLSPLGRRAFYPPDIPFQAQQARGKRYNATIGQITDGAGTILALPSIAGSLSDLSPEDRNRALLYSPIEGLPELRERWKEWHQPRGWTAPVPESSLPVVTCGLTHALALAADLFGGPGRPVLVPAPFWGNYRHVFGTRTGADVMPVEVYDDGRWQPLAIARALGQLDDDEPAVVVLNLPSNPGGYWPGHAERRELLDSLLEAADRRPLLVACDDAYAGLLYDDSLPKDSLFWDLVAAKHPQLVPIKLAGSTKEFVLFGARIGFFTLPWAADAPATTALESKLRGLIRSGVGSPVALSQIILLQALRRDNIRTEVDDVLAVLRERFEVLRSELDAAEKAGAPFRVLPFNSGAFALLELPEGVDPETIRRHLLEEQEAGVISIQPRYVRLAFCSLAAEDAPELVRRLVAGISEVAASRVVEV